jgi:hypothetical protein
MAGTKAKTTQTPEHAFEHAHHLRNQAITLVHKNGQWERCGATPVMTVRNHGNLTVTYLTPFQRASRTKGDELLGYAIEVKAGRRIVLSWVWDIDGPFFCETYRPGAWEALLQAPSVIANLAA